jgi:hypothetical protein
LLIVNSHQTACFVAASLPALLVCCITQQQADLDSVHSALLSPLGDDCVPPLPHHLTHLTLLLLLLQGLLTDIDCELRGIGGVVLAHLGLPLGQVVQLRGLLRTKYLAELAAALPPDTAAAAASEQELLRAKHHAQHVPLAEWDARAAAVRGLAERVQQQVGPGMQLIMEQEQRFDDDISAARKARQTGRFDPAQPWQLLQEAQQRLAQLELQESAWLQRGAGARGQDREDRGDGASRSRSSSRGRVGGSRAGGEGRQGSGSGRQALFDQQQRSSGAAQDRWTPGSNS